MLTACMVKPTPPEAPHPPPGIEGRYRGTARLVRASGAGCPRSGARVLEVSGDQLLLSYRVNARRLVQLAAPIASDGTIHGSDGTGTIDGKIGDNQLDVTVSSAACENHWVLTKVE